MLCFVCVCPSFLFTLKYSLWNRATVNAFQCYRQHNSWMFWVREREPNKRNRVVHCTKCRTENVNRHTYNYCSSVASTFSHSMLIYLCASKSRQSQSHGINFATSYEGTNQRFFSHIYFLRYIFFHHFLVFSFPHHDNMLPFSFIPLNPPMLTEKMVWNKNYIFYVDVSLPRCSGVRA